MATSSTGLFTIEVTAEELGILHQYQQAKSGKLDGETVIEQVVEALRKPAVYRLLQDWGNGVITLVIEFENGRVKYVTPRVEGPRLKAGREI